MLTFLEGLRSDVVHIGCRPLMLAAHFMEGLVIKKAYSLGKNDIDYVGIVS